MSHCSVESRPSPSVGDFAGSNTLRGAPTKPVVRQREGASEELACQQKSTVSA